MLKRSNSAYEQYNERQAKENRKFFYLVNASLNTKLGKDIRRYQLAKGIEDLMDRSLRRQRDHNNSY